MTVGCAPACTVSFRASISGWKNKMGYTMLPAPRNCVQFCSEWCSGFMTENKGRLGTVGDLYISHPCAFCHWMHTSLPHTGISLIPSPLSSQSASHTVLLYFVVYAPRGIPKAHPVLPLVPNPSVYWCTCRVSAQLLWQQRSWIFKNIINMCFA